MRKTFRPLRVRIVSSIAVKPGKLRLIRGRWFPGFKGDRCRFSDTIPAPPLGTSKHLTPPVMPLGEVGGDKKDAYLSRVLKGSDMKVLMFSLVVGENVTTDYRSSSLRKLDGDVPTYFLNLL